jgi:2-oxoisovalerate dehydrogenase E1 component
MTIWTESPSAPSETHDLTDAQLLDFYRLMVTSRSVDDREIGLKRQNKIFFQISGAGHEAIQAALGAHLRGGKDWYYLYYRDRVLAFTAGQTPLDHFLQAVGAEDDPAWAPPRRASAPGWSPSWASS